MAKPITRLYKKIMPHSLFGRSLLIIVLPILLTIMLATFVFFDRHWSTTTNRLAKSLAGEIVSVVDDINENPTPENVIVVAQNALKNFDFTVTYQKEIGTNHLNDFHASFFSARKALDDALSERDLDRFFIWSDERNNRSVIRVFIETQAGLLIFSIPEKRIFSTTTYIFLLSMIGGGFFLMAIAVIFMRNQVRPVRRLAIAAEKLGKGEDVERFKAEGAREVRQAANAFLVMRERIKRQLRQRTDMLAGVSHDLRTPLTRLKLQLAMFDQNDDTDAMKEDIDAMEQMINGYLAFARGDNDEPTKMINLGDLLIECVEQAQHHGQKINFDHDNAEIFLRARENALKRLFDNLISNAEKYADTCWVSLNPLPNAIEILIEDDGPGIDPQHYDDVFKPFYRIDEARNVDKAGVGLGLAIARDLAMNHGGDIRLEKSHYGGLKAVVRLPL